MPRVLIIQPPSDTTPHARTIEDWPNSEVWSRAQKTVDGWIEPVYLTPRGEGDWHLAAYVNEEGLLRGMTPNVAIGSTILVGTIVIVKERIDSEGETHYTDISDMDLIKLKELIHLLVPVENPLKQLFEDS
jgi:hypothetical protein